MELLPLELPSPSPLPSPTNTQATADASVDPSRTQEHARRISAGDHLLLRLPSGQIRTVKNLAPDSSISLGKFGKFLGNQLINKPYGLTYEIASDGQLILDDTHQKKELELDSIDQIDSIETIKRMANGICNVEDIEATNENIKESDGAQKLTNDQIEALKKSGLSGREIIMKQIEQHSAFELKSEYSKAKYIKRKEKKFLKLFTCIDPTIQNVAQYLFENHHFSIRGLRPDTLSQMILLSNVRPGWKGIVVDDIGGLLVATVLIRMGGEGTIFLINNADSPPDLHLLELFNLPPSILKPLRSLNWAQIEPNWTTGEIEEVLDLHSSIIQDPPVPSITATTSSSSSSDSYPSKPQSLPHTSSSTSLPSLLKDKDRIKIKKKFQKVQDLLNLRKTFFETGFEGLITCSEFEPESILSRLTNNLIGSSTVVIYSPYLIQLTHLQNCLKKFSSSSTSMTSSTSTTRFSSIIGSNDLTSLSPSSLSLYSTLKESKTDFIQITISEPWVRQYQVLIGRTHPEMNGTHSGGFIFSAIKVFNSCTN